MMKFPRQFCYDLLRNWMGIVKIVGKLLFIDCFWAFSWSAAGFRDAVGKTFLSGTKFAEPLNAQSYISARLSRRC
ncbi:MAG: hypothetical protein H7833_09585 [Magnetococcus sp. DMHC-1]|nr:hypothetical protein [Magnetococcales bacterium]